MGVREKSLSFCRKTDLWMTPEKLCFPLLSYSEILAELCVLSDLLGSCSLGQGRGALGWWVCCLLSSEANRLLDALAEGISS